MTSFAFVNPPVSGKIDQTARTILVTVPYGTDLTNLVAVFETTGSNVQMNGFDQKSGMTANDFSKEKVYVVTAQDGSKAEYVVRVTIAAATGRMLTSFGFLEPAVAGTINETDKTVTVTVPFGTNLSSLVARFTASEHAVVRVGSVIQTSGVTPNDFSAKKTYTIVAQDGSTQDYAVVVSMAPGVVGMTPKNGAENVNQRAPFILTFDRPMKKGTGHIVVRNLTDGTDVETIDVTSDSVSVANHLVTIAHGPLASKRYAIRVAGTCFLDETGRYFAGIAEDTTWSFHVDAEALSAEFAEITTPRHQPVESLALNFSKPITGLDASDFMLTRDGVPVEIRPHLLSGTGSTYALDLRNLTSLNGQYILTLKALNSGIQDAAGNSLHSDVMRTWQMDTEAPTATIAEIAPDPRNTAVGEVKVTFSKPVSGVDTSDFELTRNGTAVALTGLTVARVNDQEYRLDLTSVTGTAGSYKLTLKISDIKDAAGNALAAAVSDSWTTDTTAPTATIAEIAPDPRNTAVGEVKVTFSKPVTGVDIADFELTCDGTAVALAALKVTKVNEQEYTLDLSSVTGTAGAYKLTLKISDIKDATGNALAAPVSDSWTMDNVQPAVLAVSSTSPNGWYGLGSIIDITVKFSKPVRVDISGGTPSLTLGTGPTARSAVFLSGDNSDTLVFRYTVAAGDATSRLDYASTGALALNGATITDSVGNSAAMTLPEPGTAGSLGETKAIAVNAATNYTFAGHLGGGKTGWWYDVRINPVSVAVDTKGNIYMGSSFGEILKFKSSGELMGILSIGVSYPHIAIDAAGNVYVADHHRVQKFTADGSFITTWGTQGSGNGQFNYPQGIAIDAAGNVYVANHHRVQKFTADGSFITTWGTYGSGNGQFNYPQGIAIDAAGNVYVANHHRVQKFTADGSFITTWGTQGSGNGQLNYPQGIAIDAAGNVYVADHHRVQKFTADGSFITTWGTQGSGNGKFVYLSGIAIGHDGQVFVADSYNHTIERFSW